MIDRDHGWNTSFKPLYLGCTIPAVLITAAYFIVVHKHLSGETLIYTLMGIAAFQAISQLVFFLHMGMQSKTNWYLITFLFTILVMIIVVGGSVWIMHNISIYETPPLGK